MQMYVGLVEFERTDAETDLLTEECDGGFVWVGFEAPDPQVFGHAVRESVEACGVRVCAIEDVRVVSTEVDAETLDPHLYSAMQDGTSIGGLYWGAIYEFLAEGEA